MGEVVQQIAVYVGAVGLLLMGFGVRWALDRIRPKVGLAANEITTEEIRRAIAADQEFHTNLMASFGEAVKHQERIADTLDRIDDRTRAQGELLLALAEKQGMEIRPWERRFNGGGAR